MRSPPSTKTADSSVTPTHPRPALATNTRNGAMQLLLLTTALLAAVSSVDDTEWSLYKARYNKVYTTPLEDARRLSQYLKTKQKVEEHNREYDEGETSYTMGINRFADWFPWEIRALTGLKTDEGRPGGRRFQLAPGVKPPDSINWVEKGAVTSVKDQGFCGSCYAFSTVASLEGLMFRTNNTITDLSAQELVDCSQNYGCRGGYLITSFDYVILRKGIDTDKSYPYKGKQGVCRAKNGTIGASCAKALSLESEEEIKGAVGTVGPVSIIFAVSDEFALYTGGIFDGPCDIVPNHAMTAVGYGTENGTDYWLVKNSWGEQWGEKGYVRVIRNVDECNIGEGGMIPTY